MPVWIAHVSTTHKLIDISEPSDMYWLNGALKRLNPARIC